VSQAVWDEAVARGDVAAVRQLLAAGLEIDARDHHGQTALMRAAHLGHLALVEALVAGGADLDATAKYRLSALMLAIIAGHAAIARVLARAGSDLAHTASGAPGFAGRTAWDLAAARGMDDLLPELRPAWHALLSPLPADAVVRQGPVASPEVLATSEGAAIAGWEQLTVELSAGMSGLRLVLVVLDAAGRLLSASDTVLYRRDTRETPGRDEVEVRQESLGGRFEPDGTFRGTRWASVGVESAARDAPAPESTPSAPTADDIARIKALVADVLARRPAR
jgi:hypothetical protein